MSNKGRHLLIITIAPHTRRHRVSAAVIALFCLGDCLLQDLDKIAKGFSRKLVLRRSPVWHIKVKLSFDGGE